MISTDECFGKLCPCAQMARLLVRYFDYFDNSIIFLPNLITPFGVPLAPANILINGTRTPC